MSLPLTRLLLLLAFALVPTADKARAGNNDKPRVDLHGDPLPEGALARLGTMRFRHASQVTAIKFSSDGKLMATTGYDECVRLCDAVDGKEHFRFQLGGKRHFNGTIAFSADGKMLAMANGSGDKALRVIDTKTGKDILVADLPNQDQTQAVAFVLHFPTKS
jgi:WD40 repeat protein